MNNDPQRRVRITEVGPRDGLQNEADAITTEDKVAFINRLSQSGADEIEVSSFVSPRWIPQLADAADVFSRIQRREGIVYSALVPNERGLDRAIACAVEKVSVFAAASETFSKKNTNATIAETLARFAPVIARAGEAGIPVRAYVSCIVECPYEGPIDPSAVRAVVDRLLDLGVDEIDLGETIGVAVPHEIEAVLEAVAERIPPEFVTLHLHDTRGAAVACAARALQLGVRSFDASAGGLGGCPYARGASGNVATEDLVYFCHRAGYRTGIDLERLFHATRQIERTIGRPLASRVYRADGASSCAASGNDASG